VQTAGIYIHIPFCRKKCLYCDFYSIPNADDLIQPFIDALCIEIEQCNIDISDWHFDTCFIGGGTPSILHPNQLEQLLTALEKHFNIHHFSEFTIEVNPGEISENALNQFRSLGINRLSLGIQSLNSNNLKTLDRIHTPEQAIQSIELAKKIGFDNISCDLIYGIPNQSIQSWKETLKTVIKLQPEHLSAYELTVEPKTPLYSMVASNKIQMPSDLSILKKSQLTHNLLNENGYDKYEVSNYSIPGKKCVHNLHYWRIEPYLGLGPSAHSFDGTQRYSNLIDLHLYIDNLQNNKSVQNHQETLTEIQLTNEKIGFGLRMKEGINLNSFSKSQQEQITISLSITQDKWPGCIQICDGQISLTEKGIIFADTIAVDLFIN